MTSKDISISLSIAFILVIAYFTSINVVGLLTVPKEANYTIDVRTASGSLFGGAHIERYYAEECDYSSDSLTLSNYWIYNHYIWENGNKLVINSNDYTIKPANQE